MKSRRFRKQWVDQKVKTVSINRTYQTVITWVDLNPQTPRLHRKITQK